MHRGLYEGEERTVNRESTMLFGVPVLELFASTRFNHIARVLGVRLDRKIALARRAFGPEQPNGRRVILTNLPLLCIEPHALTDPLIAREAVVSMSTYHQT